MTADSVSLSSSTCDGLNKLNLGDFFRVNTPERMAWAVLILKKIEDRPEWFPRGKWATIQSIEQQLDECASSAAEHVA